MLFERLRMKLLLAALTLAFLPTAVGQGQESSLPPVADPAALPNASNPTARTESQPPNPSSSPDAPDGEGAGSDVPEVDTAAPTAPAASVDPSPVAKGPQAPETYAPAAPPAGTPQAPKFSAQVLLIETDWTKANDRHAASRLSHSLSNGVFDDSRAGNEVFPPGYAATFAGDEACRVSDDLQRLGLVRQSMPLSQVDLKLQEKGVEALGAATVSFQERAANGQGAAVVWNVLVVTEPAPSPPPGSDPFSEPRPATAPPASPPATHRVAVVSWKDQTAAKSRSQEEIVEADAVLPAPDAAPEEGERYVGSFVISTDQSAIVPLALPGLEGAMIVVAPTHKGPAVRSLGPRGGVLQRWGLTGEFSVDWDDLIRAYEASSLGVAGTKARLIEATEKTGDANGGDETADVAFTWQPAQEGQVEQLQTALKERFPQTQFVLGQFQGEQGASLIVRTPARFAEAVAEAIEGVAAQILPDVQSMNSTIAMVPSENQDEEQDIRTVVLHLQYASADETAKLLDSLRLDPAIRIVGDDRTNSIILSAPPATKYAHVQATIALAEKLDQPAQARPRAENAAAKAPPDRAANVAKLRSELARVEADVQKAAEAARSASGPERTTKGEDLRQVVAQAFELRLNLQREEAAELRDRLKKVEENLARRERIQNAVIERRVEVLLDPALEWPEVKSEGSSLPSAEVVSLPADDSAQRTGDGGTDSPWKASDVQGRGDAFAAATSLAREIADLTSQAEAIERDGTPDGSELRLALIRRQLDLLRQEFDARQQALKLELEALQAKLSGAKASFERVRTLVDTGAVPQGELAKVEAELKAAQSDVARQEVLLQQYDRARASLPAEGETGSLDPSQPQSSGAAIHPASRSATDASSFGTVKPSPFDKVPAEMLGTWRLTRRVAADGSESKTSPTTWTFDEETLLVRDSGADDVRYWLELASATPRAFRTLRIVFAENGVGYGLRCKYEIEGDSLRVVGYPDADGNLIPEKVAAAPNVDYYEFERVRDAASTSSATDDAKSAR